MLSIPGGASIYVPTRPTDHEGGLGPVAGRSAATKREPSRRNFFRASPDRSCGVVTHTPTGCEEDGPARPRAWLSRRVGVPSESCLSRPFLPEYSSAAHRQPGSRLRGTSKTLGRTGCGPRERFLLAAPADHLGHTSTTGGSHLFSGTNGTVDGGQGRKRFPRKGS
jgi:hypothetical protein